jgi:ATP-dependent 26S proteasome regulatory subunit
MVCIESQKHSKVARQKNPKRCTEKDTRSREVETEMKNKKERLAKIEKGKSENRLNTSKGEQEHFLSSSTYIGTCWELCENL